MQEFLISYSEFTWAKLGQAALEMNCIREDYY